MQVREREKEEEESRRGRGRTRVTESMLIHGNTRGAAWRAYSHYIILQLFYFPNNKLCVAFLFPFLILRVKYKDLERDACLLSRALSPACWRSWGSQWGESCPVSCEPWVLSPARDTWGYVPWGGLVCVTVTFRCCQGGQRSSTRGNGSGEVGVHLICKEALLLSPIFRLRPFPSHTSPPPTDSLIPQTFLNLLIQALCCPLRASGLIGLRVWNDFPPEPCTATSVLSFILAVTCVPLSCTATSSLRPFLTTRSTFSCHPCLL